MTDLEFNGLELYRLTYTMNNISKTIDSTCDIWASKGEMSSPFDTLALQYQQLGHIMQDYQALIQKNVDSLNEIGEQLIQMDQNLTNTWK